MAARKKYYSKKKYYKKRNYNYISNEEKLVKAIVLLTVFIGIGIYGLYTKYIVPNLENIILFLQIFIPILIIAVGTIIYYVYKRKNRKEKERIEQIPDFLLKLENKIKEFKPYKKFDKEEPYQIGLHGHLQNQYPELEVEKTIEYSRPDIIINDIAIEIKGPTHMSGLNTLPDKINKYLPKRKYLFIVLFDINIVSNKTVEENKKIYEKKKNEILENVIESKRDKIIFIEM